MTNFAQIATGETLVKNIIVAEPAFTVDGFSLVQINDGTYCSPGMFYNAVDGIFYQDEEFTTIYPVVEYEEGMSDVEASDVSASGKSTATA